MSSRAQSPYKVLWELSLFHHCYRSAEVTPHDGRSLMTRACKSYRAIIASLCYFHINVFIVKGKKSDFAVRTSVEWACCRYHDEKSTGKFRSPFSCCTKVDRLTGHYVHPCSLGFLLRTKHYCYTFPFHLCYLSTMQLLYRISHTNYFCLFSK